MLEDYQSSLGAAEGLLSYTQAKRILEPEWDKEKFDSKAQYNTYMAMDLLNEAKLLAEGKSHNFNHVMMRVSFYRY